MENVWMLILLWVENPIFRFKQNIDKTWTDLSCFVLGLLHTY